MGAPNRIWLQSWSDDPGVETTWCADRINDDDVEYVRVDIVHGMIEAVKAFKDPIQRDWDTPEEDDTRKDL